MRPFAAVVAWSVCLSVCLLVTTVSPTKTDEAIECRLACGLGWSPRNRLFGGGPGSPNWKGQFTGCPCDAAFRRNSSAACFVSDALVLSSFYGSE